jgi:predicted esterase
MIVNYSKAIEIAGLLRDSGAEVELCTSEVAHKVSSECLKNLKLFFHD